MYRSLIEALVVLAACAGAASARAQQASPPAALAAAPAPAWKQIYENGTLVYYIDVEGFQKTGQSSLSSLLEYKVPQVMGGAQVWSIVTHMKLSCDQDQMVTVDNTLYALKMGAGPVIESQLSSDTWHAPQPGSIGGLVWSAACGK
jgi:hypothetical protein